MLIATLCTLALADVLVAGKPAPALTPEKFIKGEAVKAFEPGKVYVVEFWATWCPPCVESIPHLTEIQKRNPDITVIGVAGFERGQDAAANEKMVTSFVEKRGDQMAYRVAFDSDGSMGRDWMQAAHQAGIPCAFVVGGDGKVAHIGNPGDSDSLEQAIAKAKAAAKASNGAAEQKPGGASAADGAQSGASGKPGSGSSSSSKSGSSGSSH